MEQHSKTLDSKAKVYLSNKVLYFYFPKSRSVSKAQVSRFQRYQTMDERKRLPNAVLGR